MAPGPSWLISWASGLGEAPELELAGVDMTYSSLNRPANGKSESSNFDLEGKGRGEAMLRAS